LDVFKEHKTIDALAGGDILKYEQVLEMPYETVFVKLWYEKEMAEYQKRLHEIIRNKT